MSVKNFGGISVVKLVCQPSSSLGISGKLLVVRFDSVGCEGEISFRLVLLPFRDVSMDKTIRFAKFMESVEGSVVPVRVSEIVVADGGEMDEHVTTHRSRRPIPVDELRIGKLIRKGVRALGLNFAVN